MREFFGVGNRSTAKKGEHGSDSLSPRDLGDQARERRDWAAAEEFYSRHLQGEPEDVAIWVQLGHALKEQGKLRLAENAYRSAIDQQPNDADAHLQLGHALKLQEKTSEAKKAYARSMEIEPSAAAFEELRSMGSEDQAKTLFSKSKNFIDKKNLTYFEVDDLFGYLRAHKTLSGIQRVQAGIIRNILAEIQENRSTARAFVYMSPNIGAEQGRYRQLWPNDVAQVVRYATGAHVVHEELIKLIGQAEQRAVDVEPTPGQCLFILGAFWGHGRDARRYADLKRAGVSIGVYIYDLIPLTHPQFCDSGLVGDFWVAFGEGIALFDFILTISEYTAQEVNRMLDKLNLRKIPIEAVPLAHLLQDEVFQYNEIDDNSSEWTENIAELSDRKYVLSVSTIEARKNHAYLVSAWRLMLDEGLDPPDLVFVGRYGWRVGDLMAQMRATDFLDGRIHVLHDLSDAELETLYRNCQFTVFPSYVEGWGLPVGESLAQGRPCIASNTSSIPEVGGSLVDYIDPYNLRDGLASFRRMAFDNEYRSKREKDVKNGFVARTWPEVTADLLLRIERLRQAPVFMDSDPLLNPGELFFPGDLSAISLIGPKYALRPLRPILAESWYLPESFGVWMHGTHGVLRFRTGFEAGTPIVVYLKLAGAPWASEQTVHIVISDADAKSKVRDGVKRQRRLRERQYPPSAINKDGSSQKIPSSDFSMRVDGITSIGGLVEVRIEVEGEAGPTASNENRTMSVGLIGLAYAERSDASLRCDIAEIL